MRSERCIGSTSLPSRVSSASASAERTRTRSPRSSCAPGAGLGAYRDTGVPFAGWLYGIARHVAIDALRASIRTEPRAELPDAEVEPMTAELLTLHDAIEQLPTEQRQVIELKYLVGLSNAEVAAAMDSSPGAINAKQWRALKALADVLEERA